MNKLISYLTLILIVILSSCDQLNYGYIKNNTADSVDIALSFINFQLEEKDSRIRNYVEYKMKDSVISKSVKLINFKNKTSRLAFSLCSGCQLEVIFDSAPIKYQYVEFDSLVIKSKTTEIIYPTKKEIFDAFAPIETDNKRYLLIK